MAEQTEGEVVTGEKGMNTDNVLYEDDHWLITKCEQIGRVHMTNRHNPGQGFPLCWSNEAVRELGKVLDELWLHLLLDENPLGIDKNKVHGEE